MSCIIGIDQSLRACAIVVRDNLIENTVIEATVVKTFKDDDTVYRIYQVVEAIKKHINKFNPEYTVMEGLSFSSIGNATRELGGLFYVILYELTILNDYPLYIVPPKTLKKFATGNGNAKKEQMIEALPDEVLAEFKERGYKKTTGLADLADAYWASKYDQFPTKFICA